MNEKTNSEGVGKKRKKRRGQFKQQVLDDSMANLKNYCVCGHPMFIPANKAKVICTYCYRTIYNKNELGQRQKFKDEFKKIKIKERKKKQ